MQLWMYRNENVQELLTVFLLKQDLGHLQPWFQYTVLHTLLHNQVDWIAIAVIAKEMQNKHANQATNNQAILYIKLQYRVSEDYLYSFDIKQNIYWHTYNYPSSKSRHRKINK